MPYCTQCHYDLAGIHPKSACPECGGQERSNEHPRVTQRRKMRTPVLVVVFVISTIIAVWTDSGIRFAGVASDRHWALVAASLGSSIISLSSIAVFVFTRYRIARPRKSLKADLLETVGFMIPATFLWLLVIMMLVNATS